MACIKVNNGNVELIDMDMKNYGVQIDCPLNGLFDDFYLAYKPQKEGDKRCISLEVTLNNVRAMLFYGEVYIYPKAKTINNDMFHRLVNIAETLRQYRICTVLNEPYVCFEADKIWAEYHFADTTMYDGVLPLVHQIRYRLHRDRGMTMDNFITFVYENKNATMSKYFMQFKGGNGVQEEGYNKKLILENYLTPQEIKSLS